MTLATLKSNEPPRVKFWTLSIGMCRLGAASDVVVVRADGQSATGVLAEEGIHGVVLGVVAGAVIAGGVVGERGGHGEATEGRGDVGEGVIDANRIRQVAAVRYQERAPAATSTRCCNGRRCRRRTDPDRKRRCSAGCRDDHRPRYRSRRSGRHRLDDCRKNWCRAVRRCQG